MRCKAPDTQFYRELTDLNFEFLSLFRHVQPARAGATLGLDENTVRQIAALDVGQLREIAETPTLLAGFRSLPALAAVGEQRPEDSAGERGWPLSARTFAAALMTWLWQVVRRDPLDAALCVGLSLENVNQLAGLNFREIQFHAGAVSRCLEARFSRHPRFWPDLLRASRDGNDTLRRVSRLSSIPMTLAEHRPERISRRRPRRNR